MAILGVSPSHESNLLLMCDGLVNKLLNRTGLERSDPGHQNAANLKNWILIELFRSSERNYSNNRQALFLGR